jgi:hypothetical protein
MYSVVYGEEIVEASTDLTIRLLIFVLQGCFTASYSLTRQPERIWFLLPTVLILFITAYSCLARLQAKKLKSHFLNSQLLE